VTLLVLLAAAAGAGIVAADFFARPALRGLRSFPASGTAGYLKLPLFLAMEFLFERIDRG
jgi:hypothetical protein